MLEEERNVVDQTCDTQADPSLSVSHRPNCMIYNAVAKTRNLSLSWPKSDQALLLTDSFLFTYLMFTSLKFYFTNFGSSQSCECTGNPEDLE